FRAEDGIRAKLGTGVQTCALPICAATTPAGPAPTTTTSNMRSVLRLQIGEPAKGAQSGHEGVFTAPGDHEPREPLKSSGNRAAWNDEAAGVQMRSDDRILGVAATEEDAVPDPLRLNELELPPEVRSDEREHQPAIGAVVLEDSFRQVR